MPRFTKMRDKLLLGQEQARASQLLSQLMLLLAFFANLTTSVAIIWTIIKLGLHEQPQPIVLGQNELNQTELVFNQDLSTDTLIIQDELRTDSIVSEQVSIIAKSNDGLGPPDAQINMNSDYIMLQTSDQLLAESLRLPKRLNKLDVAHGLSSVRAIRPPKTKQLKGEPHLEILSNKDLELSGNLGLGLHSRQVQLKAASSIDLSTRHGAIVIRAGAGLRLPSVLSILDAKDLLDDEQVAWEANRKQLCIDRNNGQVYASGSC